MVEKALRAGAFNAPAPQYRSGHRGSAPILHRGSAPILQKHHDYGDDVVIVGQKPAYGEPLSEPRHINWRGRRRLPHRERPLWERRTDLRLGKDNPGMAGDLRNVVGPRESPRASRDSCGASLGRNKLWRTRVELGPTIRIDL